MDCALPTLCTGEIYAFSAINTTNIVFEYIYMKTWNRKAGEYFIFDRNSDGGLLSSRLRNVRRFLFVMKRNAFGIRSMHQKVRASLHVNAVKVEN